EIEEIGRRSWFDSPGARRIRTIEGAVKGGISFAELLIGDLFTIDGMGQGTPQRLALQAQAPMVDGQEGDAPVAQGRDLNIAQTFKLFESARGKIEEQVEFA